MVFSKKQYAFKSYGAFYHPDCLPLNIEGLIYTLG